VGLYKVEIDSKSLRNTSLIEELYLLGKEASSIGLVLLIFASLSCCLLIFASLSHCTEKGRVVTPGRLVGLGREVSRLQGELPFPWPKFVYAELCPGATSISRKSGMLILVTALRCLQASGWLCCVQACSWHNF